MQPQSGPLPLPRMLPMQKAADDPPRARILIAWDDAAAASRLQRLLRELDYAVVGPTASRDEAEQLVARSAVRRPIDCALVHVGLPWATDIADRLAAESVPFVWLVTDCDAVLPAEHCHAPVLERPFDRAALVAAVDSAERQQASRRLYRTPPPQVVWPRVFPQL
jgi:DNA-binding response OmpR family regulator